MTLPDERVRAVQNARRFLRDLLIPSKTPKVPLAIRLAARQILKHYPGDLYLNDIFSENHRGGPKVRKEPKK